MDLLQELFSKVSVSSTTDILRDSGGVERDALNFTASRSIVIHRSRWRALDSEAKLLLALHELLGLTELDDSDYLISGGLLRYDPATKEGLLPKVDILLVIDDSGSMVSHQAALAQHVDILIKRIRKRRTDYHIGLTTTSVGSNWWGQGHVGRECYPPSCVDGRLVGDPAFVSVSTPKGLERLRANILSVGTRGDGVEMPFQAIYKAIGPRRLSEEANRNFFRADADLEIVVISDALRGEGMDGLTLSAELIKFKGDRDVSVSAFLPMARDRYCVKDTLAELDDYYLPLLETFEGSIFNLCRGNYLEDLETLGVEISDRVTYR